MLKKIYLSKFGIVISFFMRIFGSFFKPFMVYGYFDKPSKKFRQLTRISSTSIISDRHKVSIDDNVWIWHHSIIDGSNGVTIGKGTQIGAWVGIFSHSSHISIRLLGKNYIKFDRHERVGYTRSSVKIGEYVFIGAGAKILPGVTIGNGCLISAGAIVSKDIPDFSIVAGNPGQIIGEVGKLDLNFLTEEIVDDNYFDPEYLKAFLAREEGHD